MQMPALSLPPASLTFRQEEGRTLVFDAFRKKYVTLTPEEWVRQHFLHWLTTHYDYPAGLIAVEAPLKYYRLKKRADAIVYSRSGKPLMIIECKAPHIQITQDVFDQVARYNMPFGVSYLAVTNGMLHFCCQMDQAGGSWSFLESFPGFRQLVL